MQQRFKNIEMKAIIQAIMSSADNDREIIVQYVIKEFLPKDLDK